MLKPAYPAQTELEMVTLEQLVPKDHLLRLLDQHIRFDFILNPAVAQRHWHDCVGTKEVATNRERRGIV